MGEQVKEWQPGEDRAVAMVSGAVAGVINGKDIHSPVTDEMRGDARVLAEFFRVLMAMDAEQRAKAMSEEILKYIGQITLIGGGAAVVGFGLFKFLGKKWVDQKFAQALEKYKGEQNAELEKLKLKINTLFNKVTRIHDKEYEILPTLWQKLVVVKLEMSRSVMEFKEMPDLDRFTPEELEEFLNTYEIPKRVATAIKNSQAKTGEYDAYLDRKQLNIALKSFQDFDEYFDANKIFLRADMKEKFVEINKKLWGVWASRKTSMRAPNAPTDFWGQAHDQLTKQVEPLMKDIEDLVQKHLYEDQLD